MSFLGFPLKSGIRQGCPVSLLPFKLVLKVLATAVREGQDTKGIQMRRNVLKLSLYADDMMQYI